jgi:hypothetical protein
MVGARDHPLLPLFQPVQQLGDTATEVRLRTGKLGVGDLKGGAEGECGPLGRTVHALHEAVHGLFILSQLPEGLTRSLRVRLGRLDCSFQGIADSLSVGPVSRGVEGPLDEPFVQTTIDEQRNPSILCHVGTSYSGLGWPRGVASAAGAVYLGMSKLGMPSDETGAEAPFFDPGFSFVTQSALKRRRM